jgi:hypothetical protein
MIENERAIELLMKEYAALKSEVLELERGRFQLLALMAVTVSILVSLSSKGVWIRIILGSIPVILGGLIILGTAFMMNRIGERMCEIEAEVNALAGKELLKWETYWARKSKWLGLPLKPDYSKTKKNC